MAPRSKAAVLDTELDIEDVVEEAVAEPTEKQIINDGIVRVVESTGIDVQKNRYKAMRAIAFQAFSNAIADGTFDELVDEAIANVDNLPAGWEIERGEKAEAPVKAPAKVTKATKVAPVKAETPVKAPAKRAPAKAKAAATTETAARPARRRPAR
jgi:hypothetical protein